MNRRGNPLTIREPRTSGVYAARIFVCALCSLLVGISLVRNSAAESKPKKSIWSPAPTAGKKSLWRKDTKSAPPATTASLPETSDESQHTAGELASDDSDQENAGTVKLRYYGATWDVVFRDVAKATNSTLVGKRYPSGRFSRNDSRMYTRAEAVRIINKEIQSRGFRLVEQDDLLIVMDIPSLRPQYQPPVINNASNRAAQPPADIDDDAGRTGKKQASKSKRDPAIRKANHEVQHADHLTDDESTGEERDHANDPRTVVVFRSRHRPVLEISREVYQAYPQHSELLSSKDDGLPAFRVRLETGKPGKMKVVQFDVTIDSENEEVRIDAAKSQTGSLLKLFRALDVSRKSKETRRLLVQSPAVCRIADQLIPEMEAIRQKQPPRGAIRQSSGNAEEDQWLAEAEEETPPGRDAEEPREEPQVRRMLPQDLSDVIGSLKGEVTIESFEDLGALILKGAAEDVDQVMEVIKQLEKLSEATAPRVHLLNLSHVDSRALAELLSSVYESLTKFPGRATQPRQNVAILSITKPNAVLIVAPTADLPGIIELAEELDQPVDPLTEFQVFSLKSAVASQVETLITEMYEEPEGLGTRLLIRAEPRSNSVIVRARPRDLDEVAALIKKIDRDSSASVNQVRIFHLNSASAQELATILNQAIQGVLSPPSNNANQFGGGFGGGGGGGATQVDEKFRDVKSTVLQFLAVDEQGQQLLRSGMLADIRITPDPRMNALMVTAPERSMKLLEELINQLDRPSAAIAEIKVFPLTNADATKVVQQLQTLFSTQGQQQGGFGNQQRQQLGIQVVGAEDAGSGLIPLRFSVDTRTNSVIAIGGAEALGIVEAILLRLDEGDIRERQQAVYRLKNSPATAIANAVTQFLTNQQELTQQGQDLVSSVEQLEREVIVVAEPVSNSLLISATPRYFAEIQRLIKKLDEPPAQVIIQALLVEVTLDNTDEFGIEMGFQNGVLFNRSVKDPPTTIETTTTAPNGTQTTSQQIIAQTATPGFNFANPAFPLGNNVASSPSQVGLQSLSNFSLSRVNGDLGFGGLVLSAGSDTVNILLRALSYSRRIQVLSRPQIRTLDNQTATIIQGSLVPVVNGVQISANGLANPQIIQQEAGIILTVTPRISPDGQIVMDLVAERSAFRASGVPIFTDGQNGNVIEAPIKDLSNARAVVSVPNNQTVVIGGLINTTDDRITRKVPGLGDLPLLGYLFRYDSITTNRRELLIFLTPRLIREDADSEMIKEVEMARMHFIESEAEEVHGPLHGVPEELPIMDQEGPWLNPRELGPLHGAPIETSPLEMPKPVPRAAPPMDEKTEIIEPGESLEAPIPDSRRLPSKSNSSIKHASHESVRSQSPGEAKPPAAKKKSFLNPRKK